MSVEEHVARLQLVEARIAFFGAHDLRQHYTGLLRELDEERRRLRAWLERAFNHGTVS
jgi:hypothetical protein